MTVAASAPFRMKTNRTRPLTLAITLAAATVAIGADAPAKKDKAAKTAPAKTAPAEPKAEAKPEVKAEAKPEAVKTEDKPAAPAAAEAKPTVKLPDGVAATVDGEAIKSTDVDQAFQQVMSRQGMPPDAIPAGQKKQAYQMILENLITERIIVKASADAKVADAEVDAEFKRLSKDHGSEADITKELAKMGMTIEGVKKDLRKQMQQQSWMDGQIKGKFTATTDADVKDFYEKNPKYFEQPEQVRASHILFMAKQDATPEQVKEALKKAEAATVRAKKEDFAKLAGELSEEPGAKERGGDLNFFPRTGAMVEPFAEAAFKLKKDEVTAEPVRTQFGYHVIKATDRKAASKQPLEAAKEKILGFLTDSKKREAVTKLVADLRAKSKIEIAEIKEEPAPAAEKKPVEAVTPPVSAPPANTPANTPAVSTPPVSAGSAAPAPAEKAGK